MKHLARTYYRLLKPHLVTFDHAQGLTTAELEALEAALRGAPVQHISAQVFSGLSNLFPAWLEEVSKLIARADGTTQGGAGARPHTSTDVLLIGYDSLEGADAGARLHTPSDVQLIAASKWICRCGMYPFMVVWAAGQAYGETTALAGIRTLDTPRSAGQALAGIFGQLDVKLQESDTVMLIAFAGQSLSHAAPKLQESDTVMLIAFAGQSLSHAAPKLQESDTVMLIAFAGQSLSYAAPKLQELETVAAYVSILLDTFGRPYAQAVEPVLASTWVQLWTRADAHTSSQGARNTLAEILARLTTNAQLHDATATHGAGRTHTRLRTIAGSRALGIKQTAGRTWVRLTSNAQSHDATATHGAGQTHGRLYTVAGAHEIKGILYPAGQAAAELTGSASGHEATVTHGAGHLEAGSSAEAAARLADMVRALGIATGQAAGHAGAYIRRIDADEWLYPVQIGSDLYIRQAYLAWRDGDKGYIDVAINLPPIQNGGDLYIRQTYSFWQDGSEGNVDTEVFYNPVQDGTDLYLKSVDTIHQVDNNADIDTNYYAAPVQTGSNLYIRQDFLGGA